MLDAASIGYILAGSTNLEESSEQAMVEKDGISQGELSERFEVGPSRVTRLAKKLERDGLLRRERDPEDNRVVRMYLTEKGRGLTENLY